MTQHERIRKYLDAHGSITPMEAFSVLGITKLSTRISEMKKLGYQFKTEMVHKNNTVYCKYSWPVGVSN